MSDDTLGLPETNDPFELLGVSSEVDARGLKRAYVKRLKVFRPDDNPEAFRRVRAAYEQARDLLSRAESSSSPSPEPPPSHPSDRSDPPAEVPDETPAVVTLEDWIQGLQTGTDLGPYASSFETSWIPALVGAGVLQWSVLRRQPDPDLAVWLYRAGIEAQGRSHEVGELLSELGSKEFQEDLIDIPELEPVVWQVLSYGLWDHPTQTQDLLETYPPRADDESIELHRLELALYVQAGWKTIEARAQPPSVFERLVRAGSFAAAEDDVLCEDVLKDMATHPTAWLETLDVAQREAPIVVHEVLRTADSWKEPDDRVWDELSPAEQSWLSNAVNKLDAALSKNVLNSGVTTLAGFMLLLSVLSFFRAGWWGFLPLGISAVLFLISMLILDRYLYRRVIRPYLLARFVEGGVPPDRVVEAITMNARWDDDMGRFTDEIAEDASLTVLAALYGIRRQRTEEYEEEGGEYDDTIPRAPELTGRCATHPDRESRHQCTSCQREMCEACTEIDPLVGSYCVSCRTEKLRAVRTQCLSVERSLRFLGAASILFGGLAALVAAVMLTAGNKEGGLALLAAAAYLVAGVGTLTRSSWARHPQMLTCGFSVLVFPLGTIWGLTGLFKLRDPKAQRIYSPAYAEVVGATPELSAGWLAYVIVALGGSLVALALLLGANALI